MRPPTRTANRLAACLLATAAVAATAGPSSAQGFADIVVFGDSLSDVGNVHDLTWGITPASPPHYDGRFSNGPVWVERLGSRLGLNASVCSRDGGLNYAHGGAETGGGFSSLIIPNVGRQVDLYLGAHSPAGDELFVLWAGGNDFFNGERNAAVPLQNISDHLTELAAAGGGTFLVPNLPPLGQTPRYRGTAEQAELDLVVGQFNAGLADLLDSLAGSLGATIVGVDVAAWFESMLATPATFGLSNVTDPAYDESTGQVAPNADEYLFWDEIHPTATGHALLGEVAYAMALGPADCVRGDANLDGVVDGADYTAWADRYLAAPVPPYSAGGGVLANYNEDDVVDGADYTPWADNYAPAGSPLPEPATLALLALGACLALRRSRFSISDLRFPMSQ